MKTVGIKDLTNNLSAYLREVRRGEHILVTDRNEVIAELREPGASYGAPLDPPSRLEEWVAKGIVRPPRQPERPLPPSTGKGMPEGTAQKSVDLDREDVS